MPAGRPTKYTPELLDKAHTYYCEWQTLGNQIPSHMALANYLDISNACMYRWSGEEDKKEFRDILAKIKRLQEITLLDNGLSGEFNSNITKLVLGKHGYKEQQDLTTDGKPIVQLISFADKDPNPK